MSSTTADASTSKATPRSPAKSKPRAKAPPSSNQKSSCWNERNRCSRPVPAGGEDARVQRIDHRGVVLAAHARLLRIDLLQQDVLAQLQPREHVIHIGRTLLRSRRDALHDQ